MHADPARKLPFRFWLGLVAMVVSEAGMLAKCMGVRHDLAGDFRDRGPGLEPA
ncbi:MAG: hypothetical protein LC753_19470 [Acidobacteria bacterium]|nr:hypothetical protein [Acidobacteriota bacterium]